MRAVCYCRVSSQRQRELHTIASQLQALPRFVASRGWTLVRPVEAYVDEGRSAKAGQLERREAFARLLADAAAGVFDLVVVADLDRLTRSDDWTERGQILGAFQRAGVRIAVASTGQVLDLASSEGDLFAGLAAFFAAEENRKRASRVKAGKDRAIGEGRKPAGPTPYGLRYDRGAGAWSLDGDRAAIVLEIYRRVADGESCEAIANDLRARRVPTPRGGEWLRERVWKLATSDTYRGRWTADKARRLVVDVPQLVDDDLWYAAQEQLASWGRRGLRRTKHDYLLEGLAVCGLCGARIGIAAPSYRSHGRAAATPGRYVCSRRRRPPLGEPRCELPILRTADADARVWARLREAIGRPDLLRDALAGEDQEATAAARTWEADRRSWQARLLRLQRTEEAVLTRFRRGLVSEAALDGELAAIAKERRALERQLAVAGQGAAAAGDELARARSAAAAIAELAAQLDAATPAQRRQLALGLLDPGSVVVRPDQIAATLRIRVPSHGEVAGCSSERWDGRRVLVEVRLVA